MRKAQWCPVNRAAEVFGDRWSLLILRELAAGPQRFKALKSQIPGISMDQLSRKLDSLCEMYIIVRQEFAEAPPRVEYQLTEAGRAFLPALKGIVSWSVRHRWGGPRLDEKVEVTSTLRTMVSLFGAGEGVVLVRLNGENGTDVYAVERDFDGHVRFLSERDAANPAAEVALSKRDFIKIVARKNEAHLVISGALKGDKRLLEALMPVFRGVEFRPRMVFRDHGADLEGP